MILIKQQVCHSPDFPSRTHAPNEILFHLASPTTTAVQNQSITQSSCFVPTIIGQCGLVNKFTVLFITAIENYSFVPTRGLQDWIQRSLPVQSGPGIPHHHPGQISIVKENQRRRRAAIRLCRAVCKGSFHTFSHFIFPGDL